MKRKMINYHIGFFLLFSFLFFSAALVQAQASGSAFLEDRAGLISESVRKSIETGLDYLSEEYRTTCLAVTDSIQEDTDIAAQNYLEQRGVPEDSAAVLLYINRNDNSLAIVRSEGMADYLFVPEYNQIFYENVQEFLDAETPDFDTIVQKYQIYCETMLSSYYLKEEFLQDLPVYLDDQADYFAEEVEEELNLRLAMANRIFDTDFRITAQPTFQESSVDWAAIRYIEKNEIGKEKGDSAFLFYISQNPRKFSLMARDRAQDIFYTDIRETIFDELLPHMKKDHYEEAAGAFINNLIYYSVQNRLKKALAHEERDSMQFLFEEVQKPISSYDRKELNRELRVLSKRYDMDVVMYVSDKTGRIDPYEEAYNLAIRNRLGDDRKHDAVIYYLNTAKKIALIVPRGKAGVIFNGYALDKIESMLDFSTKPDKYHIKGKKFAEYAEQFLEMAQKGTPYNEENRYTNWSLLMFRSLSMSWVLAIIGFFLILIKTVVMIKKSSKVVALSAETYLGTHAFVVRTDQYLRSTSHKVYHTNGSSGSSGGSSSSYSSGGSSYGGTSGDY